MKVLHLLVIVGLSMAVGSSVTAIVGASEAPAGPRAAETEVNEPDHPSRGVRVLDVSGAVDSLSWAPDGATLAVLARRKPGEDPAQRVRAIEFWDVPSGRRGRVLTETEESIFSAAFSPDGRTVACIAWRRTGTITSVSEVRLWDRATGERRATLDGAPTEGLGIRFSSDLLDLSYSPDGRWVAACGNLTNSGDLAGQHIGGEVCLWDSQSRRLKWHDRTRHTDIVYAVAFSPGGHTLASGGIDKLIRLWDPATGTLKKTLFGAGWEGVTTLAFSSDGAILASGGAGGFEEGGRIRLWDVETGRLMRTHSGFASGTRVLIAFSPESKTLFAVGRAERANRPPAWELRSWDTRTGESHGMLVQRPGQARALAISPDGKFLAVGTFEAELVILDH